MSDALRVTIPPDRGALGILFQDGNTHGVQSGDVYADSGWVMRGGEKVRRWTSPLNERVKSIWEPRLLDTEKIELTYRRVLIHAKRHHDEWEAAYQALKKAGRVAHIYVDNGPDAKGWVERRITGSGNAEGLGRDWMKEKPKRVMNAAIAARLSRADTMSLAWHSRSAVAKDVLDASIRKTRLTFDLAKKKGRGTIARVLLNGRFYWYRVGGNDWGVPVWVEVAWPEDEVYEC